jgi:hypothetical protein
MIVHSLQEAEKYHLLEETDTAPLCYIRVLLIELDFPLTSLDHMYAQK